jgi:ATP-dependent helicase/nuclease subunit A
MTEAATHRQALLKAAEDKQRAAADPSVSAFVRANAGTGKTHVLVQRILRLCLAGASPGSILCLTFTKNAAAEMESRVLGELGKWATAEDEALLAHLEKLLARPPTAEEMALARRLFASVIDAPGGLAIMTIHGFCERTLRRYAFEANVPPGFAVLTEEEARDALEAATAQAFADASVGPLRDALGAIVAHANEADFAKVLNAMLARRAEIVHLLQVSAPDDPVGDIEARLRQIFEVDRDDDEESLRDRAGRLLDGGALADAIAALSLGGKTDLDGMARLQAIARATSSEQKFEALRFFFLTKDGDPRKSLMTKTIKAKAPALYERLDAAQAEFVALDRRLCGLKVITATAALLRLTAAIFERYEMEKRARGAVDFEDLIERTIGLLSRADAADWVLYQLDARIDHILVDEAQDTSPAQWRIVEMLTSDFFSGHGARASIPTVFAVGDEKQSIYGFQGARPEELQRSSASYERKAREAGFGWRGVNLGLSFRTLAPVLEAVDRVTADLPGLSDGERVPHIAYRGAAGGLVELWEPERGEQEEKGSVWDIGAPRPGSDPATALAARVAAKIKQWLDAGEILASTGRPIAPGDILILLRKREPMARLLNAALKRQGVPVAGADRMALLDELAAMDLLSLASVMLQPEDDLALAEVLKSPLFGFCDDDLFDLSRDREVSLWQALADRSAHAEGGPLAAAAERLRFLRDLAHRVSPFDFFAHVLDAEGGREAFASRLGAECLDALDEFLNLAEAFGAGAEASLAEFMASIRRGASEVKRETDRAGGEARVMTVHGAKGLEGAVVILADACGNRSASPAPVFLVEGAKGAPAIPVWAIKGAAALPPIAAAKATLSEADLREKGRLLYVAMTRARDRLHVTGFHKGELPTGCWYETIRAALAPDLRQETDPMGRAMWRRGVVCEGHSYSPSARPSTGEPEAPVWLGARLANEARLPILSPSKLLRESVAVRLQGRAAGLGRKAAQAKGSLIHKLLEFLPAFPAEERARAAAAVAKAFSRTLPAEQRLEATEQTLMILNDGVLAADSARVLAEASLAALLRGTDGACCGLIMGQADRIVFAGPHICVLDFKSGLSASTSANGQLASYRLALQRIYPAAKVEAALLRTGSAAPLPADTAALDDALASILLSIHRSRHPFGEDAHHDQERG